MIDSIRKACELSCGILEECVSNFSSFKTEKDVAKWLRKEAKEEGVKLAFSPLVICKNFLKIHKKPEGVKLNGFVILDFGVKVDGYCGDVTRMLYKGKPSKKDLELFDLVLGVQEKALKDLEIGKDYCDVDLDSRINFGKYKKYFKHSLGHGVGKKVHQKPSVSVASGDLIKEGDVITIEPGIYSKKFGIRIEDTVLVTKKNAEVLTKMSKKLIVLD
tara:strand:- start:905 stop:1555 length:651 start_codon:yes stop_codon:yes gene_type:complete